MVRAGGPDAFRVSEKHQSDTRHQDFSVISELNQFSSKSTIELKV